MKYKFIVPVQIETESASQAIALVEGAIERAKSYVNIQGWTMPDMIVPPRIPVKEIEEKYLPKKAIDK